MTQIFAYVPFKNGVAEDVALEFPGAAKGETLVTAAGSNVRTISLKWVSSAGVIDTASAPLVKETVFKGP